MSYNVGQGISVGGQLDPEAIARVVEASGADIVGLQEVSRSWLIASGTDLKGLEQAFELKSAPATDGVEWVDARPLGKDGQLQSVRVGFRQGQLAALEIQDSLGQRSVITFADWQGNAPLKAEQFQFVPPAGVDVIRP